jgi:hypothetical protein
MRAYTAVAAVLLAAVSATGRDIERKFERTVNVAGRTDLDIITDAGGISVRSGRAGAVEIHVTLKADDRHSDAESHMRALEQNPPIEHSGNTIRIGYVKDKSLLRHVSMRFEILAPQDTSVRARADSGGISVEGIAGPADCAADSGGIDVRDVASEVRANADSGGVRIRNVRGRVVAHVDSGGVEAIGVAGPMEITTDSGGVEVEQTEPAPVHVRVDSGGARVKLASTSGYDVRVRSDSGRVTLSQVSVQGTITPNHIDGKIRGGGPLVDVQVDSGNVDIQ